MDWRNPNYGRFDSAMMGGSPNTYGQFSSQPANTYQNSGMVRPEPKQEVLPVVGRFVQNDQEIKPNEVPMDGTYSVFVRNDLNEVYIKTWGGDGMIHGQTYVPAPTAAQNWQENPDPFALIMARLDSIEQTLGGLNITTTAQNTPKKSTNNAAKEVKNSGAE